MLSICEKQEKAINKNMKLNLTEHRFPFASASLKPLFCPVPYKWRCLWAFGREPCSFSTKENAAPIAETGFPGDVYCAGVTLATVSCFHVAVVSFVLVLCPHSCCCYVIQCYLGLVVPILCPGKP